jgi:Mrp family chromosome partitioning ATPase
MRRLIEEMRASHELIVITSAPMTVAETASWLSPFVDAVLVVTEFGETTEQQFLGAVARLRINRAPLIGTVLTGVETYTPESRGAEAPQASMVRSLMPGRMRGVG